MLVTAPAPAPQLKGPEQTPEENKGDDGPEEDDDEIADMNDTFFLWFR